jgi:REP element-mobilizing transposase RayT
MARRFTFAPKEFYHIYNRGVDKRIVFLDDKDCDRFVALLYLCNNTESVHFSDYGSLELDKLLSIPRGEKLVSIGAYCLMPNHSHILLMEDKEGGVSLFMQKVSTAYTMYFNIKYERTGALFAGRFKAQHANNNNYLKYLFAYIHLNPVKLIEPKWREKGVLNKVKVSNFLNSYKYSSYLDYKGINRTENAILNTDVFPEYFQNPLEFEEHISAWLFTED